MCGQVSCEFAKLDQFLTKLRSDDDFDEEWRSYDGNSVPCSYQPSLENVSELVDAMPTTAEVPAVWPPYPHALAQEPVLWSRSGAMAFTEPVAADPAPARFVPQCRL